LIEEISRIDEAGDVLHVPSFSLCLRNEPAR